ncbi:MAG: MurR/RpiR family transcriptional regulator [Gammaproteobacteria bacterium]|nr:MurR/RpiR family transcriptional regulator [Gammaproteobacteria bacterium]
MKQSTTNPSGPEKNQRADTEQPKPGVPVSIEQLRTLTVAIARGESSVVLGPKARKALGQILDLQGDPALLSITALADKLAVNPSTITRLARNLGYSGFGAFQEVLLNASMTTPGSFYSRQAQIALDGKDTPSRAFSTRLCRENQANIDRFIDNFDAERFDEAVDLIVNARRVAIHGIRQFHSFASFLAYGLKMIRGDISLIDANALGIAEDIAALAEGDVLISASCAPYSSIVARTARAAAGKNLKVIAITDLASSPLVECSRVALFVPHQSSFLSNSMTTFIVAAECLINGCAAAMPSEAKAALSERDRTIKLLAIEE